MNSKQIRRMVTTAILIALTVVFQYLRPLLGGTNLVSTYIIGSLVNLCIIVASCIVGLWSGIAISVVAPLIALAQGHMPSVFMLPWIIVGNAALAAAFALSARKSLGKYGADWVRFVAVGVIGAVIKFVIIALGQMIMMTSQKGMPFAKAITAASAAQVQQIITAIIGAIVAKLVIIALPASIKG